MPIVYEHRHVVRPDEIDRLGHANNITYLQWMQAAALAHSAEQGWSAERYHQLGMGWVVRSHQIKYLQPALEGDELIIHTWVSDMKRMSSRRQFKMFRAGENAPLAVAATEWAFVNYSTGRLARVPEQIACAFEIRAEQ